MKVTKLPAKLQNKKALVIIFLFVVFLMVLASTSFTAPANNNVQVITKSTNSPVETPPDKQTYKWSGNRDDPKYISLPTIGAGGFVQRAGVDQNNEIAVPNNVHMAAWFIKSAQPGKPGLSIIDGHVNGRVNRGIFKDLSKLKAGDVFKIELGSGDVKKFKVVSSQTVPVEDSVNVLFSQEPDISSQLNLITCGGTYNQQSHSYDKRVIVYSALIN